MERPENINQMSAPKHFAVSACVCGATLWLRLPGVRDCSSVKMLPERSAQEAGPGRCLRSSHMRMYSSVDRQGQSLFPLLFFSGR